MVPVPMLQRTSTDRATDRLRTSLMDEMHLESSITCKGKELLRSWLNKSMKIQMTDGRTLIGIFLCTDRDRNVILGSCEEYLKPPDASEKKEEPRILGLAMIPGHHIVSIHIDEDRDSPQSIM